MPETVVAGRPAGQPQQRPRQQEGGGSFLDQIGIKKLLFAGAAYVAFNVGVGWYMAKQQTGIEVTNPETGELITVPSNILDIPPYQLRPKQLDGGAVFSSTPKKIAPIWPQDSHLDIIVTLSPTYNPTPFSQTPAEYVVVQEKDFHMNNYTDKRVVDASFKVPPSVQNNGTLWAHFYIGLTGAHLDPKAPGFDPGRAYHFAYPLSHYLPKKKVIKTRNLLEGLPEKSLEPEVEEPSGPIISPHYHPNVTFAFIPDMGVKDFESLPPSVKHFLRLEATGARDGSGQNSWYYPVLYVNTFWQLMSHMSVLNDTVKELPIHIDLKNQPSWQFQILSNMDINSKETARRAAFGQAPPGGGDGTEIEMVKEVMLDTNPYLLGVTAIVSVAHIIFEMLAFGSDIAHYRKKKDNVGISVRSILANVFMQAIIFLYLLDNSQNTSWMILGSQVIGIVIEFWKITTVVDVRLRPTAPGSLIPYWLVLEDKTELTETEERTKEYDQIAFKYMYVAAVPLLIAYGIYSLFYDTHKSWYSYIITTLVGSVYAYGFLMMVPSLYINYRLKSVAHMPAKAMMYKFVNTFIDDLFAFAIKMPFLHRLATLRDDVIFFIYLYQRWAYRVDYSRVNEFGQGGEDEEEDKTEADGKVLTAEKIKAVEGKAAETIEEVQGKATGASTGEAKKRR